MCYSMLKIIKEAFPIFVVQKVTLLGKHITKSYITKSNLDKENGFFSVFSQIPFVCKYVL